MKTISVLIIGVFLSISSYGQSEVIPLWSKGAPGFENLRNEPEEAQDWWVRNVHNPSVTVYLPSPDTANGTAVVICPGGGYRRLVFNAEGVDPAVFLSKLGITAFALKYRLPADEDSPYTIDNSVEDLYRAMRLVRSRAKEWHIDPDRIGAMGFSAGGDLVTRISFESGEGDPDAADLIDRVNAKPDFQILVYPGTKYVPVKIPENAPPAFLVAAIDDPCCAEPAIELLQKYHDAGVSAEAHIYSKGGHAFNMGYRSDLVTLKTWPQRLADWLKDNNYWKKKLQ